VAVWVWAEARPSAATKSVTSNATLIPRIQLFTKNTRSIGPSDPQWNSIPHGDFVGGSTMSSAFC
jgi:hypothetical protein